MIITKIIVMIKFIFKQELGMRGPNYWELMKMIMCRGMDPLN